MKRILLLYKNAFGGLSKPAWMMSVVMLINRSGSMVTPFLSIYITDMLGYSLQEAGIILSIYGMGSVCGAYLGGWLTDKIGHFRVQFVSLTLGGSLYFLLLNLHQFAYLAAGVFILSLVNDSLRPANSASIAHYAKPENMTRAFSLNRMAINLGFSVGPAVGGMLAALSYRWLFVVDGATCIAAGLFFFLYFRKQQGHRPAPTVSPHISATPAAHSPYRDRLFLIFVYLVGERIRKQVLIALGLLLLGLSFVLLNLMQHPGVLYASMFLLSISEILAMPFMATLTVERSNSVNRGAYMGLYTISYAAAHVIAPFLGTTIIAAYGFATLWWATGILATFTAIGIYWVVQKMEHDRQYQQQATESNNITLTTPL